MRGRSPHIGVSLLIRRACLAKILILFSEGTHPVGEGACRKNAHHRGALEVLQQTPTP